MRHFGMRHFSGLALPAVTDVRSGVTYGPNSSLTGTLDVSGGGGTPPDLSDGNLSQVEDTESFALDSYYAIAGIDAEYFDKSANTSTWLVAVLMNRSESIVWEGEMEVERETITVTLRRYGTTAITRPSVGDRLTIPSLDGSRKYTLTQSPVVSHGQLEWKAEFSRSRNVKGGGKNVVGRV